MVSIYVMVMLGGAFAFVIIQEYLGKKQENVVIEEKEKLGEYHEMQPSNTQ